MQLQIKLINLKKTYYHLLIIKNLLFNQPFALSCLRYGDIRNKSYNRARLFYLHAHFAAWSAI